jgi:hypothetical protein
MGHPVPALGPHFGTVQKQGQICPVPALGEKVPVPELEWSYFIHQLADGPIWSGFRSSRVQCMQVIEAIFDHCHKRISFFPTHSLFIFHKEDLASYPHPALLHLVIVAQ